MRKLNQTGSLLLPLIILSVLFLGAAGFGVWAFMGRQDYKNNSDDKAAVAAKAAAAAEGVKKDAEFAEKLKSPLKSYEGPDTYGNLKFDFPKSWNQYIASGDSTALINLYFYPDFIPDIASSAPFALRVQISAQSYSTLLQAYDQGVKANAVAVAPYRAPKVPGSLGVMVTGAIRTNVRGVLVMLPIRDKTVIMWTEGGKYINDFNNLVLPSISYSP